MALFCSSLKPPIPCPNLQRNLAIQKPFASKTPNFEFFRISIYAPAKIHIRKGECLSSLSSPVELNDGPSSSVIIFIKGLAKSTVEGGLKTTFSQFGEVTQVKIVTDKKSKQSLGFGYVWFVREAHAQAAIDTMNGQVIRDSQPSDEPAVSLLPDSYMREICADCEAPLYMMQNWKESLQLLY